jgi:hypothetical protein
MKVRKLLLPALILMAFAPAADMFAQQTAFDIPIPFPRPRCGEVHTEILTTIDVAGQTFSGTASGTGTINFINVTQDPAGTHRADYILSELDASTDLGADVGVIKTTLTPGPQPVSTIVGLNQGQDFPAQEDLLFNARAELNGVVYDS